MDAPRSDRAAARNRRPAPSRERILTVATRMFADAGYAATSIRDIAAECGITLPSIYHFFGDKKALYDECVATTFGAASRRILEAFAAGATPSERLRRATLALCDGLLGDDLMRRLLQRAILRRENGELDVGVVEHFPQLFARLSEEIRAAGIAVHPEERAFALFALALGMVLYRPVAARVGVDGSIYATAQRLADYVLGTILPELRAAG